MIRIRMYLRTLHPDPNKMDADPQPCMKDQVVISLTNLSKFPQVPDLKPILVGTDQPEELKETEP